MPHLSVCRDKQRAVSSCGQFKDAKAGAQNTFVFLIVVNLELFSQWTTHMRICHFQTHLVLMTPPLHQAPPFWHLPGTFSTQNYRAWFLLAELDPSIQADCTLEMVQVPIPSTEHRAGCLLWKRHTLWFELLVLYCSGKIPFVLTGLLSQENMPQPY